MHLTNRGCALLAASVFITTVVATPLEARDVEKRVHKRDCPIAPKVFIIDMVR